MTDFRDENWHLEENCDAVAEGELYLVLPVGWVYLSDIDDDDAARWREIGQLWADAPKMAALLATLRDALNTLPLDALGTGHSVDDMGGDIGTRWGIRDEFISKITDLIGKEGDT